MNYPVSSTPSTTKSGSAIVKWGIGIVLLAALSFGGYKWFSASAAGDTGTELSQAPAPEVTAPAISDSEDYENKLAHMVNGDTTGRWPVKAEYPLAGAILPFKRIVAFYGNLYSKQMGILGEIPEPQMLEKLQGEVAAWQQADSSLEVVPALHYICVTAQGYAGGDKKYRLRMPFKQIDTIIKMAAKINALVFVDVQVGLSTVQDEIPRLEAYLKMPQVHLGIDPEFSMKGGQAPGKVIGTMDATDINFVSEYLAKLVRDNNLPPKMLVVHRFTRGMVTNYKEIKLRPETQIIIDMDGWGHPDLKYSSYKQYIHREPVQFTGFKLFYKNDVRNNGRLLTPKEVLALKPQPVYIQYQ